MTARKRLLTVVFLAGLTGACATQLAPAYDQRIADELAAANIDVQALDVSTGEGTTSASYPIRQPSYDHIVAELKAVDLQIRMRPVPDAKVLHDADQALSRLGLRTFDPANSDMPSDRAVNDLIRSIKVMQAQDRSAGLAGEALKGFVNEHNIYLSQAIAYETFLKR